MYEHEQRMVLAAELTGAFIDAPWTAEQLAECGAACLDRRPRWITPLAMRVVAVHRSAPLAERHRLFALILDFLERREPPPGDESPPAILRLVGPRGEAAAQPPRPPARGDWSLPEIGSVPDLAERLELSVGQLEWLADMRGLEQTVAGERLRNYRYRTVPRAGGMPRLIEAPKARLKEVQRWLLREILDGVPPHEAAHGFSAGRSAITHARLHTGRDAVLRIDLRDFFATVPVRRIHAIWRTLGYEPAVARVLAGLTTNTVPVSVWERLAHSTPEDAVQARFWLGRQLATPHLPQGAPTSPALANLAAFRLDRRLAGLATASGLRYSRYADDLTFSGSVRLIRRRAEFESLVAVIIGEEGFRINQAKSVVQSSGGRQTVCGVVVNHRTNVRRTEFDLLRAILHNAAIRGPETQNHAAVPDFRAHLLGRISWVEATNPRRGLRLRRLFAQIDWP